MQTVNPRFRKLFPRYDPVKQKLFLKNEIEIFKSVTTLEKMENTPKVSSQPNLVQAPTSPPTPRNYAIPRRHSKQSQSVINLWLQLFFDILGDAQLTKKL